MRTSPAMLPPLVRDFEAEPTSETVLAIQSSGRGWELLERVGRGVTQLAALPAGEATPDPVKSVVGHGVGQAFVADQAGGTDRLGGLRTALGLAEPGHVRILPAEGIGPPGRPPEQVEQLLGR